MQRRHSQSGTLNTPTPSPEEVKKYIEHWNKHPDYHHYRKQEELIERLFNPENPTPNIDPILVLEKVCVLETFYSTNLVRNNGLDALVRMVEFILDFKDFDDRLKEGYTSFIDEIVRRWKEQGGKNCLSFATKYCFHHNRQHFHIYDSKVVDALLHFKEGFGGERSDAQIKNHMKRSYTYYHICYEVFIGRYFEDDYAPDYGNQRCRYWCLDKYLWLLGKEKVIE